MMAGLDENGFTPKRQPEVVSDIEVSERNNIDSNISTEDDEPLGQLNETFATPIADQWAMGQAVYDAFSPLTAEGVSLDRLAALIGITRIAGTPSTTDKQLCVGDNGVVIPQGSIVGNPINLDRFSIPESVTLTNSNCYSVKYSVKDLLDSTEYTMLVNGNPIAYTSDASATELEILNGLKLDNDTNYPTASWTITVDSVSLQLIITSNSSDVSISVSSITYISADEVSSFSLAESTVIDSIIAPSNSVTEIITTVSGWVSTTNTESYIVGRQRETDEELRERLLVSQQVSGRGTVEAIQDSVRNVTGVSSATVQENDTFFYSGGTYAVTFTNGTNLVNLTGNTLADGDGVVFQTVGVLPTGLVGGQQYWVVNSGANDFQVSLTVGGSVETFTDDGTGSHSANAELPPKSFETVVQGGDDDAVALTIWQSKPAGIQSYGSTVVVTPDNDGVDRTVRFTRPNDISILFVVEYEPDTEVITPPASEVSDTIKQVMVDETSTLAIGEDVITSKYFGPIYNAINGIIVTSITAQRASGGPVENVRLAIEPTEFATTTTGQVTVTEV